MAKKSTASRYTVNDVVQLLDGDDFTHFSEEEMILIIYLYMLILNGYHILDNICKKFHDVMHIYVNVCTYAPLHFCITVEPLLSGLLRCGHLPLPDIINNRVVFALFVFVKSIWAGHPVWSRERAWRLRATLYRFCFTGFHY